MNIMNCGRVFISSPRDHMDIKNLLNAINWGRKWKGCYQINSTSDSNTLNSVPSSLLLESEAQIWSAVAEPNVVDNCKRDIHS